MSHVADGKPYGIYVYGLHKSATMLLFRLFREVSASLGIAYYSSNNKPPNHNLLSDDTENSFCRCPLRHFRLVESQHDRIDRLYHVFQVRDPRDILVSQYFSFGWSHPDKNCWEKVHQQEREMIQSMSIDEYVVNAAVRASPARESLLERYRPILELVEFGRDDILIVRYEDMILGFESWLGSITAFLPGGQNRHLAEHLRRAFLPEFSLPRNSHRRYVLPGDHANRLRPETRRTLDGHFQRILGTFYLNYEPEDHAQKRLA